MAKDWAERQRLKEEYIRHWLEYVKAHPDMPLKEQFSDPFKFRIAKNRWLEKNVDYSEYLARRFLHFLNKGRSDLAGIYSRCYPKMLKQGLEVVNG